MGRQIFNRIPQDRVSFTFKERILANWKVTPLNSEIIWILLVMRIQNIPHWSIKERVNNSKKNRFFGILPLKEERKKSKNFLGILQDPFALFSLTDGQGFILVRILLRLRGSLEIRNCWRKNKIFLLPLPGDRKRKKEILNIVYRNIVYRITYF